MAFIPFPAEVPETITDLTEKLVPVGADELIIADSEDSNSSKKIKLSNISSVPLLPKGSLITSDGSNNGELAVGADGQVLVADSAETSGLKWAAASGGGGGNYPQLYLHHLTGSSNSTGVEPATVIGDGNGTIIATGGSTNVVKRSTDGGMTFTNATLPSTTGWLSVGYGAGTFVAVGDNGAGARSTDGGATWSSVSLGASEFFYDVATDGAGTWVAVAIGTVGGIRLAYSTDDGLTWNTDSLGTSALVWSAAYSQDLGIFVIGGTGGYIATSPDGITFTQRTAANGSHSYDRHNIACGDGKIIMIDNNSTGGAISTDGINFSSISIGGGTNNAITYADGMFLTVSAGASSNHRFSYDGTNWFGITFGTTFRDVYYENGQFVLGTVSNAIQFSPKKL